MITGQPLQTQTPSKLKLPVSQMKRHIDPRSSTEIPGGAIGVFYYLFSHFFITRFSLFLKHTHMCTHADTCLVHVHTPTHMFEGSFVLLSWKPELLPISLAFITSLLS